MMRVQRLLVLFMGLLATTSTLQVSGFALCQQPESDTEKVFQASDKTPLSELSLEALKEAFHEAHSDEERSEAALELAQRAQEDEDLRGELWKDFIHDFARLQSAEGEVLVRMGDEGLSMLFKAFHYRKEEIEDRPYNGPYLPGSQVAHPNRGLIRNFETKKEAENFRNQVLLQYPELSEDSYLLLKHEGISIRSESGRQNIRLEPGHLVHFRSERAVEQHGLRGVSIWTGRSEKKNDEYAAKISEFYQIPRTMLNRGSSNKDHYVSMPFRPNGSPPVDHEALRKKREFQGRFEPEEFNAMAARYLGKMAQYDSSYQADIIEAFETKLMDKSARANDILLREMILALGDMSHPKALEVLQTLNEDESLPRRGKVHLKIALSNQEARSNGTEGE